MGETVPARVRDYAADHVRRTRSAIEGGHEIERSVRPATDSAPTGSAPDGDDEPETPTVERLTADVRPASTGASSRSLTRRLIDATMAITAASSIEAVLHELVVGAAALLDADGALVSLEPDRQRPGRVASVGAPAEQASGSAGLFDRDSTVARLVLQTRLPMRLAPGSRAPGPASAPAQSDRAWLGVPLVGHDEQSIGLLQVSRASDSLSDDDEAMAVHLAQVATTAILGLVAREELSHVAAARDEFVSFVSHELRTPLTSIKGFAQLLSRQVARRDQPDDAWAVDGLNRIDATSSRMSSMIDEVIDIARLEAGREIELRLRAVDLARSIDRAVTDARTRHERTIEVEPGQPGTLVGEVDGPRIERVVSWMLHSAGERDRSGRPIRVRITADDRGGRPAVEVRVSFADSARAVAEHGEARSWPAGQRPRLAERGLGLDGARQIARGHGGDARVEDDGPGRCAYVLRLPLRPESSATQTNDA